MSTKQWRFKQEDDGFAEAAAPRTGKFATLNPMYANTSKSSLRCAESRLSQRNQAPRPAEVPASSFHPSTQRVRERIYISSQKKDRNALVVESALRQTLSQASRRVIKNQRDELIASLKAKRSAFRDLTSAKIFGLQDPAVKEWNDMRHWYTNGDQSKIAATCVQSSHDGDMAFAYASDSSVSSIDEPKRRQISQTLCTSEEESVEDNKYSGDHGVCAGGNSKQKVSPAKATERARHLNHFRRELRLSALDPNDAYNDDLMPPLWSLEPRVFSKEVSSTGQRKYFVGQYGRFADLYWRKIIPTNRHYYEVILEKTPCRLYFDLEYSKRSNPTIDDGASEMLMSDFLQELSGEIHSVFGIANVDRSCIVDLDSSTEAKFSRHLIVHMPNLSVFRDNASVGRFVRNFVGRLAEELATGVLQRRGRTYLAKHLFVNSPPRKSAASAPSAEDAGFQTLTRETADQGNLLAGTDSSTASDSTEVETPDMFSGSTVHSYSGKEVRQTEQEQENAKRETCFVDLGVYTRNRLFRLLGSSKYGKPASAALRLAEANQFPFPDGFRNDRFYVPDAIRKKKDELSSRLARESDGRGNTENCGLGDALQKEWRASLDWSYHAEALAKTLVVPLNFMKVNFPILPECPDESSRRTHATRCCPRLKVMKHNPKTSMGPSPFPRLDLFVINVLGKRGGVTGDFRAWSVTYSARNVGSLQCLDQGNTTNDSCHPQSSMELITYQMRGNRYCENIGRAHRGNNIMWTVDLRTFQFWQSCHDPDCRAIGFRGKVLELPDDVRESVTEILFEHELASMDEAALMEAAQAAKKEKKDRNDATEKETTNGSPIGNELVVADKFPRVREKTAQEELFQNELAALNEIHLLEAMENKQLEDELFERELVNIDEDALVAEANKEREEMVLQTRAQEEAEFEKALLALDISGAVGCDVCATR